MSVKRTLLRQRRKTLGLNQEHLAHLVGVDVKTIRRWELGESDPQPWLRLKLAAALDVKAEQLDLLLANDSRRSHHAIEQGSLAAGPRQPWKPGPEALEAVANALAALRLVEDQTSAAAVLPAVQGLVNLGDTYLKEVRGAWQRRALGLASELHTYQGWLNLDAHRTPDAVRDFQDGIALAVQADDPERLSQGLSFDGFRAQLTGDFNSAVTLVDAAGRHAPGTSLKTFYTLLSARTLAMAGDQAESDQRLRIADRLLPRCDGSDLSPSTYWYTPAFLLAQRGLVHAKAGRRRDAEKDLSDGFAEMPGEWRDAGWAELMRDTLAEVS
jgi:DNA-binding XRE family transcriptional regulator